MSQFRNDAKCAFIYFLIFMGAFICCLGTTRMWQDLNTLYHHQAKDISLTYIQFRHHFSTVLIAFPFLSLMIYIAQINLLNESFTVTNPLRRWIIYGGLSVGAIFLFFALYNIVDNSLGGTLTWAKIIDYGIIISITSLAEIFFLIEVTRGENSLTKLQIGLSIAAIILFILSIYVGFSYNKTHKEVEILLNKKTQPALQQPNFKKK